MSTLKVDRIEPFSGGQVEIQGLDISGYATTGSNTFIGDQTISGGLDVSGTLDLTNTPITSDTDIFITNIPTANTEARYAYNMDSTQVAQFIVIGRSGSVEQARVSMDAYYDLGSKGLGYLSATGLTGRVEAWDKTFEGSISIFGDNTGGYIADYSPVTNDYANAIKLQPYSNYNNGLVEILRNTNITGSLEVSGTLDVNGNSTFNSDVDINGNLKVNNSTYSALSTTSNPFGLENNHTFFSSTTGLTQTLLISSGSNNNISTAKAYVSSFVSANSNQGSAVNIVNRGDGTGAVVLNVTNQTPSGSSSLTVQANAGTPRITSFGPAARIEAYDASLEGTVAIFADGAGGYIQDFSPSTNDYANAIKLQTYSSYNGGLVEVLRPLEVSGSATFNQVLELAAQDPLPTGSVGQLAVSGSNLYYHNGSSWAQIN